MISSEFKYQIFNLSTIDSTNSYALDLAKSNKVEEGHVFYSDFQLKGKGQKASSWQSELGKNLLFSLLLKPGIQIENQFLISQCVAIGLKNYLDSLAVGKVEIKWPNDILVNRQKIAGILIENLVEGKLISTTVVGIGLNVNQETFDEFDRKASSMKNETAKTYDLKIELNQLLIYLKRVFEAYKTNGASYIKMHYLQSLYGFEQPLNLKDFQGVFKGKIADVSNSGLLRVWRNGKLCSYDLKEIKFID